MKVDVLKQNFWKIYPELVFAPGMQKLYEEDTSTDKKKSSKIMWAVDMCEDPHSKYYNRPNKYEEISERFLKIKEFIWEEHEELLISYRDSVLSNAERALTEWNDIIKIRKKSLKEMYGKAIDEEDEDKLLKLDKMLAATPKMYDDYQTVKKNFEEDKLKKKGKSITSLSDQDVI